VRSWLSEMVPQEGMTGPVWLSRLRSKVSGEDSALPVGSLRAEA